MAKGLRSTVRKHNKRVLRAAVYGPASDARTERLSAKLQELVSKPRETDMTDAAGESTDVNKTESKGEMEMDLDQPSTTIIAGSNSSSRRKDANRIKKVPKKARNKLTFAAHPMKAKRLGKKA
ncbi:hypothetical protein AJ80_06438 [Polytolypa hystricis UAMH7299]|uniref:DUF2423 domain-containing protein n=1 Tax=Polytolypa hystricis (strain UAMH7299) TaxID=1447883 RepID=A0A2B7XX36_POLH7|nr:hypothetical protein AJ80_06438 [Polytolypa hystricis UAMH7299]